MIWLFILAALMGATISLYVPMISRMSQIMGSPTMGNVPFFLVALLTSIVIALASGQRGPAFAKIGALPPWLLLSGVVSAVMIVGLSFLVPRIGTGALFVMMVAGQIVLGLVINQFGLLGVPAQPITAMKALGAALVIAGAAVTTFSASA